MNVDRALVNVDIPPPDTVKELLARENPPGAQHQKLKQTELGRAEMELRASTMYPAIASIELYVSLNELVGELSGLRAA